MMSALPMGHNFNLDDVAVIRAHAGAGVDAVVAELGGRFKRRSVLRVARRHGIQITTTVRQKTKAAAIKSTGFIDKVTAKSKSAPTLETQPLGARRYGSAFVRTTADGLVPLEELESHQCHWPLETPDGHRYCGAPNAHKGYCATHWKLRKGQG